MTSEPRRLEPYERLAAVYEADWGTFSGGFLRFVDFALERHGGEPVSALDLACGTGDLAVALAGRGWRVVGLDRSPAMVRVARGKESRAEFVEGDLRSVSLGERFSLVTCVFDSLNYLLEPEDLRAAFACVGTHLEDGGLFLFDVNTPRLYEAHHHGTIEREVGEIRFRQVLHYDEAKRVARTTFLFAGATEEHVQRPYEEDEIVRELEAAGLRLLAVYGDTKGAPASPASKRLFVVATLPATAP